MKLQFLIVSLLHIILVCVLMISCSKISSEVTTISFDPKAETRSVFDTGVIKGVKLVKLESDSCIIGSIDKIICNDSLLYIMDKSFARSVFVFTKEGRFINKISRHGHGKFEYTQLWDIFFDKDRNTLCLLSRYDQKVISFTPDGKSVIGESKLPKTFSYIVPTPYGYLGYMQNYSQNPNTPYNLWTMDKSYCLLEGFVEISPLFESRCESSVNPMSAFDETILFKPEFVNTIYQIKDGKVDERYKIDFGEKTFPNVFGFSRENESEWLRLLNEKISNIYHIGETSDYILMDFYMGGQFYLGIYNKNNQDTEILSLNCYVDEYFFPFGLIKGVSQSTIYSAIEYEYVYDVWVGHNKYINYEEKYPKQVSNLRKLFPHLEENGNPFIAIYSLK